MMVNEQKMEQMMDELGFTDVGNGGELLRDAARLYSSGAKALVKEIYPTLARIHETSFAACERNMRSAIERAWLRGTYENQMKWFGYTIDPQRGKPTVREFVARMARVCRED